MKTQPMRLMPLLALLTGAVLGFIGGPVEVLLIWALAGLLLGFFSFTRRSVIASGLVFGFVVSFIFMITGYAGDAPLYTRFLPFAALGAFGAVCGLVLSLIGHLLQTLRAKHTE